MFADRRRWRCADAREHGKECGHRWRCAEAGGGGADAGGGGAGAGGGGADAGGGVRTPV